MNLRIESLTSSNQNDLFSLFETSHYEHAKSWKTCYCRFYHTSCSFEEWISRNKDTNKQEAISAIAKGEMQGFLAYDEDICIGWVNANSATKYDRLQEFIPESFRNDRCALTICYVIKEEYRGQKVASSLLDHAIRFFKEKGFHHMLSIPVENNVFEKMYRGPIRMYLNRGYEEISRNENQIICVLQL